MDYILPNDIKESVEGERGYQNRKWGKPAEHPHDVGAWLTIMRVELREAEEAWCHGHGDWEAMNEILQVVAVGVACMEQHGVVTRADLSARLERLK
jgi:hypothetical protein